MVIEAVSILRKKNLVHPGNVLMAGEGSLQESMNRQINALGLQNIISIINPSSNEALWNIYKRAKILVTPSRVEGFGMVILEAGWVGVPSVGSEVPGIVDAIIDGQTGLLFEQDNAKACADKLQVLIENEEMRAMLGKNAMAKAKQFISNNMTHTFCNLLEEKILSS